MDSAYCASRGSQSKKSQTHHLEMRRSSQQSPFGGSTCTKICEAIAASQFGPCGNSHAWSRDLGDGS